MKRRILRDAGVLLLFCGVFYLLIVFVGRLDGDANEGTSELSQTRKQADLSFDKKDWPAAAKEYQQLTEMDPLNGHAWSQLAEVVWQTRINAFQAFNEIEAADDADSERVAQLNAQIDTANQEAFEIHKKLIVFARYRARALLRLCIIEIRNGNDNEALDWLEEFLQRGHRTRFGLANIQSFGESFRVEPMDFNRLISGGGNSASSILKPEDIRLHAYERFWKLVELEKTDTD
ncbi:MAG: hypothetical protein ACI87E_001468 [Mariniblastus sp.]|jgi:hypothetical protein